MAIVNKDDPTPNKNGGKRRRVQVSFVYKEIRGGNCIELGVPGMGDESGKLFSRKLSRPWVEIPYLQRNAIEKVRVLKSAKFVGNTNTNATSLTRIRRRSEISTTQNHEE